MAGNWIAFKDSISDRFRIVSFSESVNSQARAGVSLIAQKVSHAALAQPGWDKCHPLTLMKAPHAQKYVDRY